MAKKVDSFIEYSVNEAEKQPEGKSALISAFFEALGEATEDGSSYSYSCYSGKPQDPDKDYEAVLRKLYKEGWSADALKNLFQKYGKDIANEYNGEAANAPLNGLADVFLYKMTKGAVQLSGMNYKSQMSDIGVAEFWIKFAYGYHKSKYGQLAINQSFGNVEKWKQTALDSIISTLTATAQEEVGYEYDNDSLPGTIIKNSGLSLSKAKAALEAGYKKAGDTATLNLAAFKKALPHAEDYESIKKTMIDIIGSIGFEFERSKNASSSWQAPATGTIKGDVITLKVL